MSWRQLFVLGLALCGCGAAEDPEPAVADPEMCGNDTPFVSWETFGQGFLSTHCQGCHAAEAFDRRGAPEDVTFDEEEDAIALRGLILGVATGAEPTMPPNGGPTEDDRERLTVWLGCFAEEE